MVAGYVSKDSLSRCDTPSMLYDTVRKPNAPSTPLKPISNVSSKDTIETTEQRLKREMIDRFQAKGLELPHETYVAVVQVGKYVFLAIMLPVYVGLYAIPHWFLVTGLPQLFGMAGKFSLYCGRFSFALAKRVSDLMKGMLEQLIGDALRLSRDRAKNLWKRVITPFAFLARAMERTVKTVSSSVHSGRETLTQVLRQFHDRVHRNMDATHRWLLGHAMQVASICGRYLKGSLRWADRKILTPLIAFCLPSFEMAARAARGTKEKMQQFVQKSRRLAKAVADPIVERLQKARVAARKVIGAVIDPVANWIVEKKEVVDVWLAKMKKAIGEPIAVAAAFIKSKIPDFVVSGWNVVKPVFGALPRAAGRMSRFAWKKGSRKFKDNMDRKRQGMLAFGRALKGVVRGTISGLSWIWKGMQSAIHYLFQWAVVCLRVAKKLGRKLMDWLVVLPRKIKRVSLVVFKVVGVVLSHVSFTVHVIVLLVWLASINAFYLTRRMVRS